MRSYTIRKDYRPAQAARPRMSGACGEAPSDSVAEACETLARAVLNRNSNYREIERRLFARVRGGAHTIKEAAELLGWRDPRTLQARLKPGGRRPAGG